MRRSPYEDAEEFFESFTPPRHGAGEEASEGIVPERFAKTFACASQAERRAANLFWSSLNRRPEMRNIGLTFGEDVASLETAPTVIDPFPAFPFVFDIDTNVTKLNNAVAAIKADSDLGQMCAAVVDLTDKPNQMPYAGFNDTQMLYVGSLLKIAPFYVAFELRDRVRFQARAEITNGLSPTKPGWENVVINRLQAAWTKTLSATFPGLRQDLPNLAKIFTFSSTGQVDFKAKPISDAKIDLVARDMALVENEGFQYLDCLKSMMRWSNNKAASKCISPLGFPYLNGVLQATGLYHKPSTAGLWMSGDYLSNVWGAPHLLSPPWRTLQAGPGRPGGRSDFAANARSVASLLTMLAQDFLLSTPADCKEMRSLMTAARGGLGSRVDDALRKAGRVPDLVLSKGGRGDAVDDRRHDCAIVERTIARNRKIRYVVVGLGSKPGDDSDLKRMFVKLDDAIASLH